ncbi:hypothetical protein Tco_0164463 [Tanacetum coccineum]
MQAWYKFLEIKHAQSEEVQELLSKHLQDLQSINEELEEYINTQSWNLPTSSYDDDDDEYSFATQEYLMTCSTVITPDSPKTDSPIMEDEHLDTIPETKSDELIKSSVEDLVHTPSESDGISEGECDSYEDIDYVDASPPDSELASLEVAKIVIPEVGGIDTDILLTIKDDILRENFLNVNLLIAKIEALKDNPTPSSDFVTKSSSTSPNFFLEETNTFDNSLPESETFCFNLEEKSSGSTTTHADFSQYDSFIFDLLINLFPPADRSDFYHEEFAGELAHIISPPEYDHFYFKIEPELGNFTMDVVEDIFDNPTRKLRVHVPNVLPTHPTLHLDSDFTISSDSLGSDLVVSFPSGTRNKIFDPGIFIRVQSKIFLSRDAFSISFICDPLFLVIDTLLPFSSKNKDKVVNTGILAVGD